MKDLLKNFDSFNLLSNDDIEILVSIAEINNCKSGDVVLKQSHDSDDLFFVLRGSVSSTLNLPGSINRISGQYSAGDFFGELTAFSSNFSLSSFAADEDSEIIIFSRKKLQDLISENPDTAARFTRIILSKTINRLRESSTFLADVVQWGEDASRRVITDEMTGIYNRAFLDDAMDNFFHISKSNRKAVSLLMIDVDNFRNANDALGLDVGDEIIKNISSLMQRIIEKDGIIARFGGDEFSILLPEADMDRAAIIAEEIRRDVEKSEFSSKLIEKGIPITVSIGVSSYPQCGNDLQSFREKADKNLYKAKEDGRNRVVY